jgi:hypothetical protein
MKPLQLLHILDRLAWDNKARRQIKPHIRQHRLKRAIILLELLQYKEPVKTSALNSTSRTTADYRFIARWEGVEKYITQEAHAREGYVNPKFYTYVLTKEGRAEAHAIKSNLKALIELEKQKNALQKAQMR